MNLVPRLIANFPGEIEAFCYLLEQPCCQSIDQYLFGDWLGVVFERSVRLDLGGVQLPDEPALPQ